MSPFLPRQPHAHHGPYGDTSKADPQTTEVRAYMTTRLSPARSATTTAAAFALALSTIAPAGAAEVVMNAGSDKDLTSDLRGASLSVTAIDTDDVTDPQELIAAAKADYQRLVAALYDKGYFEGTVSIKVDGREASSVSLLNPKTTVNQIAIDIVPGPRFTFSEATVAPLPPKAEQTEGFAVGEPAGTGLMRRAAKNGVDAWRNEGHAKARVDSQQITAQHQSDTVAARFGLTPGPRLTFGKARLSTRSYDSAVRPERIMAIAGLPEGEVFDPTEVTRAETRLRRAGAFSSAVVSEDENITPVNQLGMTVDVADAKPRRLGFGAEISNTDGLTLSSYWMHRNLLGGAERFRVDGEVAGIGGGTGGMDYSLGVSLTRPAFRHPDMDLTYSANIAHDEEPSYTSSTASASVGVDRYINEKLTASLGVGARVSRTEDDLGERDFYHLTLDSGLTWENRDNTTDPTKGIYADVSVMPFLGVNDSASGVMSTADIRGYQRLGSDKFVLAARVQLGSVVGPSLEETPSDWLFYSGGGGSVRGQGYQSLGVTTNGNTTGGRSYGAISTELRARVVGNWGAAAFVDYGYVSRSETFEGGEWQGGAGLGARYFTSLGPVRLDVAVPITGEVDSVSVYVGIGQSF